MNSCTWIECWILVSLIDLFVVEPATPPGGPIMGKRMDQTITLSPRKNFRT